MVDLYHLFEVLCKDFKFCQNESVTGEKGVCGCKLFSLQADTKKFHDITVFAMFFKTFCNDERSIHDLQDLSFLGVSIEALALRFREFATGDDRISCVLKSIQNLFNKDFKGIRIKSMQQTFIRDIMGILLHQSCFQFTLEGSTYCTCTYFTSEPTNQLFSRE